MIRNRKSSTIKYKSKKLKKVYKQLSGDLYIYIITHPKFDGWIKVGRTIKLINRLKSYNVGCPNREYKYEYTELLSINKVREIEQYFKINIHSNGFEWYNISVQEAIDIINEISKHII